MLPCETQRCAYRRTIPGDRHSTCARRMTSEEIAPIVVRLTELSPKVIQWFMFPYNFDPVWGPDQCLGFATEEDSTKLRKFDALEELLLVLMGKRCL